MALIAEPFPVPTVPRRRAGLVLGLASLDWIVSQSGSGGLFGSVSHACERALARLRDEQQRVREECRRRKIAYSTSKFWGLHAQGVQEAKPSPGGRPMHGTTSSKGMVHVSLAEDLLDWAEQEVERGPFKGVSHLVDVGLGVLREEPVPNLEALMAAYRGLDGIQERP